MRIGTEEANGIFEQERYARLHGEEDVKKIEQEGKTVDVDKDVPVDKYIPSITKKGIYRPGRDDKGNPKIDYVDPQSDGPTKPDKCNKMPVNSEKSESTTINTDKVDREIEKLKEKKARLEQELHTAEESRKKEIEKELQQIEMELMQKDNDTYRLQGAVIL